MYTGFKIGNALKDYLMVKCPPKFSRQIGHHITHEFEPEVTVILAEANIKILKRLRAYNIELFLVSVDGKTHRPDGSGYHLTWSLDPESGAKPFDSNCVIAAWESGADLIEVEDLEHLNIYDYFDGEIFS